MGKKWKVEFGPFRWLEDTDDYGKWQAAYYFLFVFIYI